MTPIMSTYIYSLFPNFETLKVLPLGNAPSRSEDDRFTVYPTSLVVYERIQKECVAYATHFKFKCYSESANLSLKHLHTDSSITYPII